MHDNNVSMTFGFVTNIATNCYKFHLCLLVPIRKIP